VACMGDRRGVERVLMERPDGKRPLGRHVACMGDTRGAEGVLMERDHLEDIGVDGSIILK